jgi:protein-S-isoprenylcysteine O-methyltransferase Ste14
VTRTIDYSALLTQSSKAEVVQFRKDQQAAANRMGDSTKLVIIVAVVIAVIGFPLLFVAATILVAILASDSPGDAMVLAIPLVFGLLVFIALVALAVFGIRRAVARYWETSMRLTRFAQSNGLIYSPADRNPQYPGMIFGIGSSRIASHHLRSASGRYLNIGNYKYTTGSGKNRTVHDWGFMALHLDRKLPHMVLDSRANNLVFGMSNLPAAFSKEQVLGLEGNFGDYFTLYCPQQYERDALYVFTPDLMADLIDEAAPFDVEIIDDWMFVYSSRQFVSTDPAIYQRLFRIVDTVGARTLSQTDRYVDERVADFAANTVAPQGLRLKRTVSVVAIVAVVLFVVFTFARVALQLL